MYYVLEDTLRLPHDVVKWSHAAVKVGAILCSILGFIEIYYSNGANCNFSDHFLSREWYSFDAYHSHFHPRAPAAPAGAQLTDLEIPPTQCTR